MQHGHGTPGDHHLPGPDHGRNLGEAPKLFAFPNGGASDHTAETMALLREAGFEAAFTMQPGFANGRANPMETAALRRAGIFSTRRRPRSPAHLKPLRNGAAGCATHSAHEFWNRQLPGRTRAHFGAADTFASCRADGSARRPGWTAHVLHFTQIGGGGAEAMLGNLVESMQGGAWRNGWWPWTRVPGPRRRIDCLRWLTASMISPHPPISAVTRCGD